MVLEEKADRVLGVTTPKMAEAAEAAVDMQLLRKILIGDIMIIHQVVLAVPVGLDPIQMYNLLVVLTAAEAVGFHQRIMVMELVEIVPILGMVSVS